MKCTLASFFLSVSLLFSGCAAQKPATVATANQSIVEVIADAGTVAILAEQQYQAGTIPQTATNRQVINDLGNAYNQAKTIFGQVLQAEAASNAATLAQVTACTPGAGNATLSCPQATKSAQVAQANLTDSQATLQNSVNALVTRTSSVKAITHQ